NCRSSSGGGSATVMLVASAVASTNGAGSSSGGHGAAAGVSCVATTSNSGISPYGVGTITRFESTYPAAPSAATNSTTTTTRLHSTALTASPLHLVHHHRTSPYVSSRSGLVEKMTTGVPV